MAYALGADIKAGDRFKSDGKWYNAAGDAGPFVLYDGQPHDGLRAVLVKPGAGTHGGDQIGVLAEVAYQLPGGGVPLTVYMGGATRYWEVDFTRGQHGDRWYVCLHGAKTHLGWLVKDGDGDGWAARVSTEAFQVHSLDRVPGYLTRASSTGHSPVGGGKTMADAAGDLLRWLEDRHAPALGHGPHYDVDAYDDPWCPGSNQRWADDGDGSPVCPACRIAPVTDRTAPLAGGKWPPRRRGPGRWDGKVSQHLNSEARAEARR